MHKGTCVHFCGSRESTCEAGVNLREITGGPDLGWFIRIPCHKRIEVRDGTPVARVSCEKYQDPTDEQVAEDEADFQRAIDRMNRAAPVISKIKRDHRGRDMRGSIECPICGGTLHYSHSSYNGHVHGKCMTADCLN